MTRRKSMTPQEVEARITVDRETGCWRWTGAMGKSRKSMYPVFGASAVRPMVFEAYIGPWEKSDLNAFGMSCGQVDCVRPDHMDFTGRYGSRAKAIAVRASVTHCKHGHEFAAVGFYLNSHKARVCKACHLERSQKYRKRT